MSDRQAERYTHAFANNRYVAQFPGGRVVLRLDQVPLHALTPEDRELLDSLIRSMNELGKSR